MPLDTLRERLEQSRPAAPGACGLVLTGGEPSIHKQIVEVVRIARELGYSPIQLQTNGRLLSSTPVLLKLLAAGVSEISPSLHGSKSRIHEGLTRAPGSWQQSVAGIARAVASGVEVITNSVITRSNVDDLPALVALLGALGARHAQLAFVHPVGTALENFHDVVPRLSAVVPRVAEARLVAQQHGMRLVTEAIPYCFLRSMEDLCVESRIPETTVIDLDGRPGNYSTWHTREGKAHGPPCSGCAARTYCEGPWREYPAMHGWDEFVPFAHEVAA